MRLKIYPYKAGSKSAKDLAKSLKCLRLKLEGSRFRPRGGDVIINWGNSQEPNWMFRPTRNHQPYIILNKPSAVAIASNKLSTFRAFEVSGLNIPIPDFTTDTQTVSEWLREGFDVMARSKLTGHSGDGIELLKASDRELIIWVDAPPLFTKYIKKKHEYRIHVMNGAVIDVQQKRKRREVDKEDVNFKVRNHENGWCYCREDVVLPDGAEQAAINAVECLGLDFGSVDIIYNKHREQFYVLEVNTASGLEGTTLEKYTEGFQALIDSF